MTYEGLRLKVLKYWRVGFANYRKKMLKRTDFTIISNNCWGGMIYESYDIPKMSPTAGLFFMASDYIKFISDLKAFISSELRFVQPSESRWKGMPVISGDGRFGTYPVGLLSNGSEEIEVFFLHYHSAEEAKEKWERRCKRINWNKLLIKFNDQNECTEEDLRKFLLLPYKNKVFFTCKNWNIASKDIIYIKQRRNQRCIQASYEPFGKNRYLNVTERLNLL